MPKIGKSTDKLPAHVMWVEQNDHQDHLFTTMGIGKLQKRKMYENEVLPVLIVRNYHDKFHMIGKTDISYRLCGEEDYKNLEKGKWVKIKGWEGPAAAKQEILEGIERYNKTL